MFWKLNPKRYLPLNSLKAISSDWKNPATSTAKVLAGFTSLSTETIFKLERINLPATAIENVSLSLREYEASNASSFGVTTRACSSGLSVWRNSISPSPK